MSSGKIASQAGHAYLDTYLKAYNQDVNKCMDYKKGHGIKVCLKAKKESDLHRLQEICETRNIPCAIIEDLGYTCFGGKTTITCLGIGPIRKWELPELQKLGLLS